MTRPYTGTRDGVAKRATPGILRLADLWHATDPAWRNNGTFGIRPKRNNASLSVHATGRALDMSRRGRDADQYGPRSEVAAWADVLAAFADPLGIELIVDYGARPAGRSWKCDRGTWLTAKPGTWAAGGSVWGDWLHVELSPAMAANPDALLQAWADMVAALAALQADAKPARTPRKRTAKPAND